eukprot:1366120-Rhodomonas_salina.2
MGPRSDRAKSKRINLQRSTVCTETVLFCIRFRAGRYARPRCFGGRSRRLSTNNSLEAQSECETENEKASFSVQFVPDESLPRSPHPIRERKEKHLFHLKLYQHCGFLSLDWDSIRYRSTAHQHSTKAAISVLPLAQPARRLIAAYARSLPDSA